MIGLRAFSVFIASPFKKQKASNGLFAWLKLLFLHRAEDRASGDERHEEKHEEDEEEDLRDAERGAGDSCEAEESGDDCDDKKRD
jgi:hypothetical protein